MKARTRLGLAKMSIPKKIEKARQIVTAMGNAPIFVTPVPVLAEVTTATNELEDSYTAAKNGGPALTAVMYDKEEKLDSLLAQLGNYVEIVANGDDAVILAAGMDVKGKASRQAFQFSAVDGDHEAEAILQAPVTARASYIWQKSADPLPSDPPALANGSKWELVAVTTLATVTASDLVSGIKYWFRVAAVTSAGQGLWSDPISLRAQ